MNSRPSTFQKLGLEESLNKLKLALGGHTTSHLEIWEMGEDGRRLASLSDFSGTKVSAGEGGRPQVEIPSASVPSDVGQQKSVVLLMSVGKVHYLAMAGLNVRGGNWCVSLLEGLNRPEARRDERLLAYPHHQAFAFFLMPKQSLGNVISLNRSENRQKSDFSKFKEEGLRETLQGLGIQEPPEGYELLELRVIDLASQGLSVLANAQEAQGLHANGARVFLSLNGEKMALGAFRPVHQISFLDTRSPAQRSVDWFKVGLELAARSAEYENLLEKYLDEKMKAVVRGEFAHYVEKSKK